MQSYHSFFCAHFQDNSSAAVAQRQQISAQALSVVISISTASSAPVTPSALAQSALMVSSIVAGGMVVEIIVHVGVILLHVILCVILTFFSGSSSTDSASSTTAAAFASQVATLAIQNTQAPLPALLMSSVLDIISSTVSSASSVAPVGVNGSIAPVSTLIVPMSVAQASSIASSATSTTALLSKGALVGALPGEAPVVIQTPKITISAQLQSTADISKSNYSLSNSPAGANLPTTMLSEAFATNSSAIPSVLATSLVQFKDNIYSFASDPGESTTAAVVSFSLSSSGTSVDIQNLLHPLFITIPLDLLSMPDGFSPACRFWDASSKNWSSAGCAVLGISRNSILCACTHLTAFNLKRVFVPEVNVLTAQDFINLFNLNNIIAHPIPLIAISSLVLLWMLIAYIYRRSSSWRCCNDDLDLDSPQKAPSDWLCLCRSMNREKFTFNPSTVAPEEFFKARLRDHGIDRNLAKRGQKWYHDINIREVARAYLPSNLLGNHNYMNICAWFFS
jgi:hypothetical protein